MSTLTSDRKSYPSKLLLFGEYTVLEGSKSLAIPFHRFSLRIDNNGKNNFTGFYSDFYEYLIQVDFNRWNIHFDGKLYQNHFESGSFYRTDIPVGYGLGSSGSVTAAVYEMFFHKSNPITDLNTLKEIFAEIENYFHGKSSGIDPLIIYLDHSLMGSSSEKVSSVKLNNTLLEEMELLLLDSGISRSTSDFVKIFHSKMKTDPFFKEHTDKLITINNSIIEYLIGPGPSINLFEKIKEVSQIQLRAFEEMIPVEVRKIWERLLEDESHVVKLCGAGGGGFFYIFSKDPESFKELEVELKVIHTGLFKNCG